MIACQKDQLLQIFHEGTDFPLAKSKLDQENDFPWPVDRSTCLPLRLTLRLQAKLDTSASLLIMLIRSLIKTTWTNQILQLIEGRSQPLKQIINEFILRQINKTHQHCRWRWINLWILDFLERKVQKTFKSNAPQVDFHLLIKQ